MHLAFVRTARLLVQILNVHVCMDIYMLYLVMLRDVTYGKLFIVTVRAILPTITLTFLALASA